MICFDGWKLSQTYECHGRVEMAIESPETSWENPMTFRKIASISERLQIRMKRKNLCTGLELSVFLLLPFFATTYAQLRFKQRMK